MNTTTLDRWNIARICLIGLCLSGAIGILAKQLLQTEATKKQIVKSYTFPDNISLKNWQFIKSEPFQPKNQKNPIIANQYRYRQQSKDLRINTVYEQATGGNVSRLLMVYESIPPATVVINEKYESGIGHYGSFEYKDRAYISACINPKGNTTVTQKQFVQNRYLHTSSLPRFFGWLAGQNDLFDARCLWVALSIPVNSFAPPDELKKNKDILESASLEWFRWWKQNYPES